jgi:hypothetical protein
VIALGSVVFAIYKFASYDKKIASLDTTIKEYQVKSLKKEDELSKRAKVGANPYSNKNGLIKVKFYNSGKSIAHNINFKTIDDIELQVFDLDTLLPFPILNPQESFEVQMRYWGQEAVCRIKITWEDECGKQEYVQALQLI